MYWIIIEVLPTRTLPTIVLTASLTGRVGGVALFCSSLRTLLPSIMNIFSVCKVLGSVLNDPFVTRDKV